MEPLFWGFWSQGFGFYGAKDRGFMGPKIWGLWIKGFGVYLASSLGFMESQA